MSHELHHPVDDRDLDGRNVIDADLACRYCGCWDQAACVLDEPPYACSWYRVVGDFAVCSNPDCVKAYLADQGAP